MQTAVIKLWGQEVGAVTWLDTGYAIFEYSPEFTRSARDISPIHMPINPKGESRFMFPALNKDTFMGLPGLLADSLPDKFGNAIIDEWLARQGRSRESFNPVERLCYTGSRGMGALEFTPAIKTNLDKAMPVEIAELVRLTQNVMSQREQMQLDFSDDEQNNEEALRDILRIGTSAGGARPKAIIAINDKNGHVLSGQADVPEDYDYWLLKFDGVDDIELGKPQNYGRIEYAYYLMAKAAGIEMSESRLLEENGRAHFMTRRFDRVKVNNQHQKRHMQSLCGIAHYDFNMAGAYSYEQAFAIMREMRLPKTAALQQYKRMLFNIFARNQDDHTKNIAFLMDKTGQWSLSPAYDVTYSHNPAGAWTNQHQMSINGKRDDFDREDLIAIGKSISLPKPD
ncbi:MAG: type II toxin-antitoxin system HipA family toxin, partial [Gammaproteobacteria bacterium]|nr:type II toxin-antitoxin system HipA family toxin [Gammaproteobacteria bacterium]